MIRNRFPFVRPQSLPEETSRYHWKSDRDEGFTEVQFVYDKEGHLLGVDYRLPADERRPSHKPH